MARKSLKFTGTDKHGVPHKFQVEPEANGYSIKIDGRLRYSGQTFTKSELALRFATLARWGYIFTFKQDPFWVPKFRATSKKQNRKGIAKHAKKAEA